MADSVQFVGQIESSKQQVSYTISFRPVGWQAGRTGRMRDRSVHYVLAWYCLCGVHFVRAQFQRLCSAAVAAPRPRVTKFC